MKYQLIKPINKNYSAIEQILTNRGIEYKDLKHYLNTTDEDINSPLLLGEDKLKNAASLIAAVVIEDLKCAVIVDSDCDGFSSSALLINYLYDVFPHWANRKLFWIIHEEKEHGLKDCCDEIIKNGCSLVIVPDAGSNNYEYHKILKDNGIDTIVIDHHEAEKESEDAIIINNQLSDYPNKFLSGAGVTWQFCRYIDMQIEKDYANNYLDLVALSLVSDMMSIKSIETKQVIFKGFREENIKNPFIYEIIKKNNFSLNKTDYKPSADNDLLITPMGAAFFIAPFVNAIVRSGSQEEKELIFKSMLKKCAFEEVISTKRGHKENEKERLVDQAMRVCTNVKNRQTKAQDEGMELLENMIIKNNMLEKHKVLLFLLESGQINKNIAGLVANKIMNKYQRPVCVLTKVINEMEDGKKMISYQGSARGYGVEMMFKDICAGASSTIYAEG